jgi:hypothetical protein
VFASACGGVTLSVFCISTFAPFEESPATAFPSLDTAPAVWSSVRFIPAPASIDPNNQNIKQTALSSRINMSRFNPSP